MIAPILKPMVPENYQQMVDMVLQLLPNAKTLEFGLNFNEIIEILGCRDGVHTVSTTG